MQTDQSRGAGVCRRRGVFAVRENETGACGGRQGGRFSTRRVESGVRPTASAFLEKLLPVFNEEEAEVFRRGRNAKKATKSKNASVAEYNRSTGFEAVLGFLYLSGDVQRISELLALDGRPLTKQRRERRI